MKIGRILLLLSHPAVAAAWTSPRPTIHRLAKSLLSLERQHTENKKDLNRQCCSTDADLGSTIGRGNAASFPNHPWSRGSTAGFLLAALVYFTPLPSSSPLALAATPSPSSQVALVNVQIDANGLQRFVWDNRDELVGLVRRGLAAANLRIEWPSAWNWVDLARDALGGDVLLNVNGVPVDVSILSQRGGVDLAVISDQGDLSLTIASQYLPKLPLLEKNKADIPVTPEAVAEYRATRLAVAQRGAPPLFFWDDVSLLDYVFHQGWTNGQVLGSTALAIGYVYFAAKTVYDYEIRKANREAQRVGQVKAALDEKKTAIATARRSKASDEAKLKREEQEEAARKEAIRRRKAALELEVERLRNVSVADTATIAKATTNNDDETRNYYNYLEQIEYSPTVLAQVAAVVPQRGLDLRPRQQRPAATTKNVPRWWRWRGKIVQQDEASNDRARQEDASTRHADHISTNAYSPTVVPQKRPDAYLIEQTNAYSSSPRRRRSLTVLKQQERRRRRRRRWFSFKKTTVGQSSYDDDDEET
jgi:hypothetical protein